MKVTVSDDKQLIHENVVVDDEEEGRRGRKESARREEERGVGYANGNECIIGGAY